MQDIVISDTIQLLVIASIHQPSTTTFELFDKLLLLSKGKVAYNGPVSGIKDYFAGLGLEANQPQLFQKPDNANYGRCQCT